MVRYLLKFFQLKASSNKGTWSDVRIGEVDRSFDCIFVIFLGKLGLDLRNTDVWASYVSHVKIELLQIPSSAISYGHGRLGSFSHATTVTSHVGTSFGYLALRP
jgi:hypothetical protein